MARFVKQLLVTGGIGLLVYFVVLALWGTIAPLGFINQNFIYPFQGNGHSYTRLREAQNSETTNILVLGSSHAYRGIDPRYFNTHRNRLFNLGSSSQTPIQSLALYQYYAPILQPDTLLLEINPDVFRSDGVESALDLIANSSSDFPIVNFLWDIKSLKVCHALNFRFLKNLFGTKAAPESTSKNGDLYHSNGFVEKVVPPQLDVVSPLSGPVKTKQVNAFRQLINLANADGVTIILMEAPVRSTYFQKYSRSDFNALIPSGVLYYNFNLLELPDSYFYDNQHLNSSGVSVFNSALLEFLKQPK